MLNRFGGFPEPFLSGSEQEAARRRNQYYSDLIREDIPEFGLRNLKVTRRYNFLKKEKRPR